MGQAKGSTFQIVFIFVVISNLNGLHTFNTAEDLKTVKKDLPPEGKESLTHSKNDMGASNHVISNQEQQTNSSFPQPITKDAIAEVQMQVEMKLRQNNFKSDDIPHSFQIGFYFFLGLSSVAVIFIVVKVYRLRLSRAERRYGVQGDRTTQELTPLPISIEDANSDDDDQTLFELNRQQIRIL